MYMYIEPTIEVALSEPATQIYIFIIYRRVAIARLGGFQWLIEEVMGGVGQGSWAG